MNSLLLPICKNCKHLNVIMLYLPCVVVGDVVCWSKSSFLWKIIAWKFVCKCSSAKSNFCFSLIEKKTPTKFHFFIFFLPPPPVQKKSVPQYQRGIFSFQWRNKFIHCFQFCCCMKFTLSFLAMQSILKLPTTFLSMCHKDVLSNPSFPLRWIPLKQQ